MAEQIDVREVVVTAKVFQRCLAAGQEEEAALQTAAQAVHAWRNRDESDQRLAPTFAQDWPI